MSLMDRPSEKSKNQAINELVSKATHDRDFYVLLVGANLLALGAIFTDSIAVLIASMIVAPLAFPILAIGLGLAAGSGRLITHAVGMLILSCLLTLTISIVLTLIFGHERAIDRYISFHSNREIAIFVAVISGLIASYGLIKPKVSSAITGVAIAVSLMPPLVATGVGIASRDSAMWGDALTLFLLNVAGILLASFIVFRFTGVGKIYQLYTVKES